MIRVLKWWDKFENAGSRKLKTCSYFCIPSGNDSKGYRKLMRQGLSGVAAFGVFQAICQVLPTLSQDARRNGSLWNSDGSSMDIDDLCDLTRLSVAILLPAIEILKEIGWIEAEEPVEHLKNQGSANQIPSSATDLPIKSQETPDVEYSRVEESRVLVETSSLPCPTPSDVLETIWPMVAAASRNRSSKKQVADEWKRIKTTERPTLETLTGAVEAWNASEQWTEGYAEGLHLWIRRRKWEDLPTESRVNGSEPDIGGRTMAVTKISDLTPEQIKNLPACDELPI